AYNRALEQVVAVTLVAFLAGAVTLLAFASRLSIRLRRLRDEAEAAIDSQGRVRKLLHGSAAGDEIGDLSRSFSTALERLAQYNAYLEHMAGRLSHELRTPLIFPPATSRSASASMRAPARRRSRSPTAARAFPKRWRASSSNPWSRCAAPTAAPSRTSAWGFTSCA